MAIQANHSKNEGKFTDIKAAITSAWSGLDEKWFRLDFQENGDNIDVIPKASDNEGVGVDWRVLPDLGVVAQYATDMSNGDSTVEREMKFNDSDELEKIFDDEFRAMNDTLAVASENGADIHPLSSEAKGASDDIYDSFLDDALDCAVIEGEDGTTLVIKFTADAGDFLLTGFDGETKKTLKSGKLFAVADYFRELLEMDAESAIREFEKE